MIPYTWILFYAENTLKLFDSFTILQIWMLSKKSLLPKIYENKY